MRIHDCRVSDFSSKYHKKMEMALSSIDRDALTSRLPVTYSKLGYTE